MPLFVAISGRSAKSAFLLSYLSGIVFLSGVYRWILEAPGYNLYHHAILAIYLGPYFGLFGGIVNLISRRLGATWSHLAMPFVWVAMEFARSNLSFLALPFPILAHSQYPYLKVIRDHFAHRNIWSWLLDSSFQFSPCRGHPAFDLPVSDPRRSIRGPIAARNLPFGPSDCNAFSRGFILWAFSASSRTDVRKITRGIGGAGKYRS